MTQRQPDRLPDGRLAGRLIGLGVTGSIAAYKAVELLRALRAEDAVAGVERATAPPASGGGLTIQVGASIADLERVLIRATLEHVAGDKPAAARILGISVKTLYNRLNVYEAAGH